jgi:hypothetical protein
MNTKNLAEEINAFSGNKLKRRDDLKTLLDISFENDKSGLLEDVSFTAKYIMGLQRVIKKGSMNPEISNLEQIKLDYMNNIQKSVELLKEIVNLSDIKVKNHFEEIYFQLSHSGLSSLRELLEDLEWTKMYFNQQKRGINN